MINQIFRVPLEDSDHTNCSLDISLYETTKPNSNDSCLELGVCVYSDDKQFDGSFTSDQLTSFIDYLTRCREYIQYKA